MSKHFLVTKIETPTSGKKKRRPLNELLEDPNHFVSLLKEAAKERIELDSVEKLINKTSETKSKRRKTTSTARAR